ncbi:Ribonuclease H domain [Sesbania bispinosa]|nr:Ribonuclease H domain [Sesbania bispinosa]
MATMKHNDIVKRIHHLVAELVSPSVPTPHLQPVYGEKDEGWSYPADGCIKCNIDVSSRDGGRKVACGGVFRNTLGYWVNDFTKKLGSGSVLSTELQAIYTALHLGKEIGVRKLWIKSDSIIVVHLIEKRWPPYHLHASLLKEIERLCKEDWSIVISHGFREGNLVADWMANFGHNRSLRVHVFQSLLVLFHCFDMILLVLEYLVK